MARAIFAPEQGKAAGIRLGDAALREAETLGDASAGLAVTLMMRAVCHLIACDMPNISPENRERFCTTLAPDMLRKFFTDIMDTPK